MPTRGRAAPREADGPSPDLSLAGRAWFQGKLQSVEIGISEGGRILRVGRSVRAPRRLDLGEMVLMPSAVDLHVHFREPGGPNAADDLATGTLQAVLGGVAVVGEMPNTEPPVRSGEMVAEKAARVRGRAACDVVLYAMADDPRRIRSVARSAGALKLYTAPTTGAPDPPVASEWPALLESARATDLPLSVHAEDPLGFAPAAEPVRTLADWDAVRPEAAERGAVERILRSAGTTRLHFAHVTQAALAEQVRAAGYSCEATPQHLLLSHRTPELGTRGRVNPPLRSEATRAALFDAFASGRIPILASDHAPHPPEEKERSMALSPSGTPSVETMVPLLLARVARAELPLPVLQSAAADRPARWFGLPMGRLARGHRASLIAVDFRRRVRIRSRDLHAPSAPSAFEGLEAVFPRRHFLNGESIVEDGEYVGRTQGRVRRPEFARGPATHGAASG